MCLMTLKYCWTCTVCSKRCKRKKKAAWQSINHIQQKNREKENLIVHHSFKISNKGPTSSVSVTTWNKRFNSHKPNGWIHHYFFPFHKIKTHVLSKSHFMNHFGQLLFICVMKKWDPKIIIHRWRMHVHTDIKSLWTCRAHHLTHCVKQQSIVDSLFPC